MSSLALDRNAFDFVPDSSHISSYRSFHLASLGSAIPQTVLIDSDRLFAFAFERVARRYHVPVCSFDSFLSLQQSLKWEYDLVILDLETVGKDSVGEITENIELTHGDTPILLIGYGAPPKTETENWSHFVKGFSDKKCGVEAVFSDVVHTFLNEEQDGRPKLTLVR